MPLAAWAAPSRAAVLSVLLLTLRTVLPSLILALLRPFGLRRSVLPALLLPLWLLRRFLPALLLPLWLLLRIAPAPLLPMLLLGGLSPRRRLLLPIGRLDSSPLRIFLPAASSLRLGMLFWGWSPPYSDDSVIHMALLTMIVALGLADVAWICLPQDTAAGWTDTVCPRGLRCWLGY